MIKNDHKIIIAGGRDFGDYDYLQRSMNSVIANLCGNIQIVSGRARGADTLGEQYAKDNNLDLKVFPANWEKHGRSAGYIRNSEMANYANTLIAFWDGKSRGTKHMIDEANRRGFYVEVFKYDNNS